MYVPAFRQIVGGQRAFLITAFQLPSTQSNPYAKSIFGEGVVCRPEVTFTEYLTDVVWSSVDHFISS